MAELQNIELGSAGVDYLAHAFLNRGLCSYLGRLPLSSGVVFAPHPAGTTLARARNLENGGLPPEPRRDYWLADRVLSLFAHAPDGTFIVEDVWGPNPTDPCVTMADSRMLFSGDVVYYVVTLEEASRRAILDALIDTASFLLVAAFSRFELPPRKSQEPETVGDAVIEQIAKETLEIYVSAYDQEGFVVWQRG